MHPYCKRGATVVLRYHSHGHRDAHGSTTVALPLHYRRTAVEAKEDDRLYRRVVSPKNMGRCPDSGVTSCPAGTCGHKGGQTGGLELE